jgi:UDPglucose 6-dehydrogenase
MARIGIFGAGYVGLVTGTCFADLGHDVVVRDVVPEKIERLRAGEIPIFEPGLDELVERNRARLTFTTDVAEAMEGAEFLYIAVGTPRTYSGDADLSAVWTVIDELAFVGGDPVVVMKSTVPVGTGDEVRAALDAKGLARVGYVSNPEFLAEGSAIRDFMHPDRIVVGAFDPDDAERVVLLHERLELPEERMVRCDVASAEMVKLAANAFLSTRISFINEIANVCELVGADVESVAKGVGLDHRLGPHFLRAGIGFGGSCLLGDETVLVRQGGRTSLRPLARVYAETEEGAGLEALAWVEGRTAFSPVHAVTRRKVDGDIVELRTKMGRRVRSTVDHPFVTRDGIKLAGDLTTDDWLPLAQLRPQDDAVEAFTVLDGLEHAGLAAGDLIVRAAPLVLEGVGARSLQRTLTVARSHDVVRAGALRLDEALELGMSLDGATYKTAKNGTSVPATLDADQAFWRVVGLYLAEGHVAQDGERLRIAWSFHPRDEFDLVEEVFRYWAERRVRATITHGETAVSVSVSSRLLAGFWLGVLGLGRNAYDQRLPDAIWSARVDHKLALLAAMWRGDGSWSLVGGGPSVILEYGTVSRELADGVLRLLGDLGVVASLRVGRTAKSTRDTYWIRVTGADQVEQLLDFVPEADRRTIVASIARQAKRTRPMGYRRSADGTPWVRVVEVARKPFSGAVYSLELPETHTFVTTGGLVTHNCFPKDVSALKQLAGNSGYHFQLLSAVIEVNELQKRRVVQKLQKHLGQLRDKTIALLGLAFKPNTDDLREAPSLVIAARLLAEGAEVRAWDPVVSAHEALADVTICDSIVDAVRDADAAVIVTEWPQLAGLLSADVRDAMARPLIVDGRNFLDPVQARTAGFAYEGVGRPSSAFTLSA